MTCVCMLFDPGAVLLCIFRSPFFANIIGGLDNAERCHPDAGDRGLFYNLVPVATISSSSSSSYIPIPFPSPPAPRHILVRHVFLGVEHPRRPDDPPTPPLLMIEISDLDLLLGWSSAWRSRRTTFARRARA